MPQSYLYSRSEVSICDTNFIFIDKVPEREYSLREFATTQNTYTDQGMLECFRKRGSKTRQCT